MIAIVVIASIIVTAAGFEVPTIATDGTSVTVTASDLILEVRFMHRQKGVHVTYAGHQHETVGFPS